MAFESLPGSAAVAGACLLLRLDCCVALCCADLACCAAAARLLCMLLVWVDLASPDESSPRLGSCQSNLRLSSLLGFTEEGDAAKPPGASNPLQCNPKTSGKGKGAVPRDHIASKTLPSHVSGHLSKAIVTHSVTYRQGIATCIFQCYFVRTHCRTGNCSLPPAVLMSVF